MPKPANEQETRTLELSIPAEMHAYLLHLARYTPMGVTPNDVARYILTARVLELVASGYPAKHPY